MWISPAQEAGFDALWPEPGESLTVVVDRPHIASHYSGDQLVTWLNEHAYRWASDWQSGYEAFDYFLPTDTGARISARWEWPNGVAVTSVDAPASARRGAVLPVTLALACLDDDWDRFDRLFTNLLGPEGTVLVGQEGPLLYGNLASAGWTIGETALDRRGIWLPTDAPSGEYELLVGFADEGGFVPLTLAPGRTADYASVARIVIEP